MTSIDKVDLFNIHEKSNSISETARKYAEKHNIEYTDSFRRRVSNFLKAKNNEILNPDEKTLIEEYRAIKNTSEEYGVDYKNVRSGWLKFDKKASLNFKNPLFEDPDDLDPLITEDEFKKLIKKGLKGIKRKDVKTINSSGTGVVKIADLHLGAYVDNLIRTKKFSIDILAKRLNRAAEEINKRNYETVHVHILGDLIESFTGLSHKNTWKGLDKVMVGAESVKLSAKIIHKDFLNRINNLELVKIVAGNHDRVTSDNKEDVKGDAANLIGWGLSLMGYDVEFNPLVITHEVDGICHILTHGHHHISKKTTQQICWDYGVQGKFNLICEGHLHSIIEKLSAKQVSSFQVIKDDSVDHRRMNCPSFFTGNFYSESLGYTSQSGLVIVEDNGEGIPNVFYYAV